MANLRADNLTGTGGRESINGSVYFDGESSHLKVLTTSDLALGTGDFTLECWVYQEARAWARIFDGNNGSSGANQFDLYIKEHWELIQVF